jgi:hypothetical protein
MKAGFLASFKSIYMILLMKICKSVKYLVQYAKIFQKNNKILYRDLNLEIGQFYKQF